MTALESQLKALEQRFHILYDNQVKHAHNTKKALDHNQERLKHHRQELDVAQQERDKWRALVASISDKLCHCSKSPIVSGKGTLVDPWQLDEGLEYLTPPGTLSTPSSPLLITSAPQESSAPVQVPAPVKETSLRDWDAENVPPACCLSASAPVFTPMSTL